MGLAFDAAGGEIVMFGGCCDDSGNRLGDTWTWRPTTGLTQETPANSPGCRNSTRLAYDVQNQEIVLFGGSGFNTGCSGTATRQNDTWTWNGSNWTEEAPASRPGVRVSPRLAYDPRSGQQSVVMFGGNGDCGPPGGGTGDTCNDTWTWNGSNWTQCQEGGGQACATRPPARSSGAMAFHIDRGAMVMTGGRGSTLLDDTWDWGGISVGWTNISVNVGAYDDARTGHRIAYDPIKEAILLFGGCTGGCSSNFGEGPGETDTTVNDTWSLNGGTWDEKTVAGTPPSARCCTGMAFFDASFDQVVLVGGQDENNPNGLPGVWYWDWNGANGEWVACDGTDDSC